MDTKWLLCSSVKYQGADMLNELCTFLHLGLYISRFKRDKHYVVPLLPVFKIVKPAPFTVNKARPDKFLMKCGTHAFDHEVPLLYADSIIAAAP